MTHTAFCAESELISEFFKDAKHKAADDNIVVFMPSRLGTSYILKMRVVSMMRRYLLTLVYMGADTHNSCADSARILLYFHLIQNTQRQSVFIRNKSYSTQTYVSHRSNNHLPQLYNESVQNHALEHIFTHFYIPICTELLAVVCTLKHIFSVHWKLVRCTSTNFYTYVCSNCV